MVFSFLYGREVYHAHLLILRVFTASSSKEDLPENDRHHVNKEHSQWDKAAGDQVLVYRCDLIEIFSDTKS